MLVGSRRAALVCVTAAQRCDIASGGTMPPFARVVDSLASNSFAGPAFAQAQHAVQTRVALAGGRAGPARPRKARMANSVILLVVISAWS